MKYEELLNEHSDRFPELLQDQDAPSVELISQQISELKRKYPQRASDPQPVHKDGVETQAVLNSLNRRQRIRTTEAFRERTPPARPKTSQSVDVIVNLYERGRLRDFDWPYHHYYWWKDWIHACKYLVVSSVAHEDYALFSSLST